MRPTLIIGLGGAGSRVATGIYEKFLELNPTQEELRKLTCLCFDTDEADLRKAKEKLPREWVVDIAPAQPIQPVFDLLKSGSSVQDWFDTGTFPSTEIILNKGTSMRRQAARLALLDADAKGKLTVINQSITYLSYFAQSGLDVDVRIVCSLAGGTGSGTFLQIAYYVKEIMIQHGISYPYITGHFFLADVFHDVCHDVIPLEFMRANTYASLRELNALVTQNNSSGQPIEFEYRYGQSNKTLPPYPPYNLGVVMDGKSKGYCMSIENCYDSMSDFMLKHIFSPIGDANRSAAINNIRYLIRFNGKLLSTFGMAKLVYPVEDLFKYFTLRHVSETLTNWLRIDQDFQAKYEEYKKEKREGIPAQEPKKGAHYRNYVGVLSQLRGCTGAEFREIYRSTQILDEDNQPTGISKAQVYFNEIREFVRKKVNANSDLEEFYEECKIVQCSDFIEDDNYDNNFMFVDRREHFLNEYKKEVERYIDNVKRFVPKQCFFADFEDNDNYVSKTPDQARHHLNTFILPKDEELHPVAVRYFLYELQDLIKPFLARLENSNKDLWKAIQYYTTLFDDPDTDYTEDAVDFIESAKQRDRGAKKVFNRITGQKPYKKAKIEYEAVSRRQAEKLHDYTINKMLEETLSSLLGNITRLLEESENFFNKLPESLREIENECNELLVRHDSVNDKDITYVLASAQNKKDIYDYSISQNKLPFPSVLSAAIYRSMYKNVCEELEEDKLTTAKIIDKDAKRKAAIEANKRIITECIAYQDKIIRKSNNDYATKNVIEALKEEAMRECNNDWNTAKKYMERKFQMFQKQAEICGSSTFDSNVLFINAWGVHPSCVAPGVLTQAELDNLFDNQNVGTYAANAASRLISEFFSPFEIVRVNQAYLLPFSQFDVTRTAYDSIVDRFQLSTLLDKRWDSILPELPK